MSFKNALSDFCLPYQTVWVAYSGGLDSQVLLSCCNMLRKTHTFTLRAVHIHHGLNPAADQWALHCRQYCQKEAIEYHEQRLQLFLQPGDSLENAARYARYEVFAGLIQKGDILLTAHHQNDQAETLLLQLLRGAGPKGLAAMPPVKPFGRGSHGRPLLNFSREALLQYANEQSLIWVEDDSNTDIRLARNFIRHEVMPLLNSRWPNAQGTIARSARHCAEAQVLLEEFAVSACLEAAGSKPGTLSVSRLLAMPAEKQRLILRSWIYQAGCPLPGTAKLETIVRTVLKARWDRKPHVRWPGAELRRHRDDLYIQTPLTPHDACANVEWRLEDALELVGIGILKTREVRGEGLRSDLKRVSVRFRQGGETARLAKRKHKDLKKLFQEWNVLPWERNRIPLLFDEDKLIAAVGYFIDPDYMARKEEIGLEILLISK